MIKFNSPKKGSILFVSLTIIALIFITISTSLLYNTRKLRSQINKNVSSINVLSRIENEAFEFISAKNQVSQAVFKSNIKSLLSESDDKYLFMIKSLVGDFDKIESKTELKLKAIDLDVLCKQVIRKKRNQLANLSDELSNYWLYLYILIGIACALSVILSFVGYKVFTAREEVYQLENQNNLLINNSIDSVMSCDLEGNIIELNSATEKMFGYGLKEMKKINVSNLYGSDFEREKVHSSILKNGTFSGEIKNKHKNGSIFDSYLSANLMFNSDGEKVGVMGISRDISKQKELEDQFQLIVRNATDIIYTTDNKGVITYVNEAGINFFEREIDELIGMSFSELVVPEQVDMVTACYRNQYRNTTAETYLELQIVTKSGEKKWAGQNVRLLYDAIDKNKIIGYNGIQRNINKRKEAELKLEESEANFRLISSTINDVFFLYNLESDKYEFVSSNCLKILGVKEDYFYGGSKYVNDYVLPDDKQIVMKAFDRLSQGEPYDIDYRILIEDKVHWVNECAFPIFDKHGKVMKNSGTCRDITESVLAKRIIDRQNIEIAESIQYSKIILDSTLPTQDEISKILPESFVYSSPKSVISGDFYIIDTIELKDSLSYKVFLVGDCTGHGVPGGILSILCSSLIKDSFYNINVKSPADALNLVREKLINFFRSSQSRTVREGMDIAFCVLNERDKILHYSGAKNSCILIRNNQLFEYKGDPQHVGYSSITIPFTLHEIKVEEGDCIYLYSDGYMDQFGGPRNKKFMKKRFRELLFSLHDLPIEEQEAQIKRILKDWQGDTEQTDDITVLGVKLFNEVKIPKKNTIHSEMSSN